MKKFLDVNVFLSVLQVLIIVGLATMFLFLMSGCEAEYPNREKAADESPRIALNCLNRAADSDLKVVFVPEAYTAIQMGEFLHEVSMAWEMLRQASPYKYCLDKMNVYYTTELVSYSDTLGISRTAFGLEEPEQYSAHADICLDSIMSVSKRLPFPLDKTVLVVLANLKNRNLGFTLLTIPASYQYMPQTVVIPSFLSSRYSGPAFIHEMGHAVGLLADEYYGSEEDFVFDEKEKQSILSFQEQGAYLNVSISPDSSEVYWREFLADNSFLEEKIGIYEGGRLYPHGVWRSTDNSVMRHHFESDCYNALDRYLVCKRIEQIHSGRELTYSEWKLMDSECPMQPVDWVGITGVKTRGNDQAELWKGDFDFNDVVIVE